MSKTLDQHNYNGIDATIIADSRNNFGQRITTFICTFPRIVLAEFNTHRMLSRNSESSRAVPFLKKLERIRDNPFIPIKWMKDHKGMQGNEYFTDPIDIEICRQQWLNNRNASLAGAKQMSSKGITKQIVNRLLEPFMWHTCIATATEWENFFALRAHEAAEIHIQDLAYKMLDEYNINTPKQLKAGEWHIPFGDTFDEDRLIEDTYQLNGEEFLINDTMLEQAKRDIATARCARVSYVNFDGKDDYIADIKLTDRLSSMGHWSPFEHCAIAMNEDQYLDSLNGMIDHKQVIEDELDQLIDRNGNSIHGWSGNFRGFIQYRKMFNNENKTDDRIIK